MQNPYFTQTAKIVKITEQAPNINLFRFDLDKKLEHTPGQIILLSIPGFGEAPFAPCNAPDSEFLELCVRKAGRLTSRLHKMKAGDKVGIRGPYGNGWMEQIINYRHPERSVAESKDPVGGEKQKDSSPTAQNDNIKNLLIVVGGLGLVPLRTLLSGKDKFLPKTKIQIFYCAKTPDDFLFQNDFDSWREKGIGLQLTIDKECPGWNECVGLVPVLFEKYPPAADTTVFLCGPPVMYKFVLDKLKEKNVPDKNIFLSLERRMHCGIGVCQHCAVGSFYTCKDGPVFRYTDIKNIEGAI